MRPPYMTMTSSVRPETTLRSCDTMIIAMCRSACSCCSRSRMPFWIVTSSAVVASSAMSRSGEQVRAIAIITRWRMPPEN